MLLWMTTLSSSINISNIATEIAPLCSLYKAPSSEPDSSWLCSSSFHQVCLFEHYLVLELAYNLHMSFEEYIQS